PHRPHRGAAAARRHRPSDADAVDAVELCRRHRGRAAGRVRHAARWWLHLRSRRVWDRAALAPFDHRHARVHGDRHGGGRGDAPRVRRLAMPIVLAALVSGLIFGFGLAISGMTQPTKVLGFLDLLAIKSGTWDPTLAFVMIGALAVAAPGYLLTRRRGQPLLAKTAAWPSKRDIDRPLIAGAVLFGIGWGLVGLCPGPAVANFATFSSRVVAFVLAMAAGMLALDFWRRSRTRVYPAE